MIFYRHEYYSLLTLRENINWAVLKNTEYVTVWKALMRDTFKWQSKTLWTKTYSYTYI